jgi:hypothetical protein
LNNSDAPPISRSADQFVLFELMDGRRPFCPIVIPQDWNNTNHSNASPAVM